MSEEMLIRHCSPTLAGMKTGNLFACHFDSANNLLADLEKFNAAFSQKGLRALLLCYKNNRALIYVYRPKRLYRDLQDDTACRLLRERGYKCDDVESCIVRLTQRLGENEEFPHEIGLFLGYPPEDVCGFIENRAECYKCVGCWKVYGDAEAAQKTFAKYKKCTNIYCKLYAQGKDFERLVVAV